MATFELIRQTLADIPPVFSYGQGVPFLDFPCGSPHNRSNVFYVRGGVHMAEEASFFQVLEEEVQPHEGRKCDLSKAFDLMDKDFRREVQVAMNSPTISAASIARALNRFHYRITESAIRRCRRSCDCWKVTS